MLTPNQKLAADSILALQRTSREIAQAHGFDILPEIDGVIEQVDSFLNPSPYRHIEEDDGAIVPREKLFAQLSTP